MILLTGAAEKAGNLDWATVIVGFVVVISLYDLFSGFVKKIYYSITKKVLGDKASEDLKEIIKNQGDRLLEEEKLRTKQAEKISDMSKDISSLKTKSQETNELILAINEAIIEVLYDKISQRARYYINELKGIPEDEVESFNRIFAVYSAIGGNHGLGRKVEYCNKNLPILPPVIPKDHE